jgi:TPR repeat protein
MAGRGTRTLPTFGFVFAVITLSTNVGSLAADPSQHGPTATACDSHTRGMELLARSVSTEERSTAARMILGSAEEGCASAEKDVASLYDRGDGVRRDGEEARRWMTRAADDGDADAMLNLGLWWLKGHDVRADASNAAGWILRSASKGNAEAERNLGLLYKNGTGVGRSDADAFHWIQLAANAGDAAAQNDLGLLYAQGIGVDRDPVRAASLYQAAAAKGNTPAFLNLGYSYYSGSGVRRDYALAAALYRAAAEKGNADAEARLAFMYAHGQGVPQDDVAAVALYRRAADGGDVEAEIDLAFMYGQGRGVPKDVTEAFRLESQAAASGDARAQRMHRRLCERDGLVIQGGSTGRRGCDAERGTDVPTRTRRTRGRGQGGCVDREVHVAGCEPAHGLGEREHTKRVSPKLSCRPNPRSHQAWRCAGRVLHAPRLHFASVLEGTAVAVVGRGHESGAVSVGPDAWEVPLVRTPPRWAFGPSPLVSSRETQRNRRRHASVARQSRPVSRPRRRHALAAWPALTLIVASW